MRKSIKIRIGGRPTLPKKQRFILTRAGEVVLDVSHTFRINLHLHSNCLPFTFENIRFFFQAEDGIRDTSVTGVQTCALPISGRVPLCSACDRSSSSQAFSSGWITCNGSPTRGKIGRASCRERVLVWEECEKV